MQRQGAGGHDGGAAETAYFMPLKWTLMCCVIPLSVDKVTSRAVPGKKKKRPNLTVGASQRSFGETANRHIGEPRYHRVVDG